LSQQTSTHRAHVVGTGPDDGIVCLFQVCDALWIGTTDEPTKDMTPEQELAADEFGQKVVARSRITGSRMLENGVLVLRDGAISRPPTWPVMAEQDSASERE
jgi:hypothetical protein